MARAWLRIATLLLCLLPLARPARGADPAPLPVPVAARELILGNGTPGPFPLSWTKIRFASEQLSVQGTPLCPILDYEIDDDAGTITFSQPLPVGQIVQVAYRYDAARATRNHALTPFMLTMRVWGSGSGGLQMIGAVAPDGTAAGSLVGFRGETALGGSRFSSLFLLAPNAGGSAHAPIWRSAALQLGASCTRGALRFHAAVGQAGSGFSPANDYQLQQGLRVLDFGAAFAPSKWFSFTSQVEQQVALDASQKGNEQTRLTHQLTLAPAAGTKLTMELARNEYSHQARDRTSRIDLDAEATPRLRLHTHYSHRDSSTDGQTDTVGFGLNAGVRQSVAVEGGYARTVSAKTGSDTASNLLLTIKPAEQLGFHLGFSQHLNAKQGNSSSVDWGVSAGRGERVAVEGSTSDQLAAGGPGEHEEQLRVSTAPLRWVKVSERSATKLRGETAVETQETAVELSPLRALQLAGALGQQAMAGEVTHTRSISGSLEPAPFLDLSGSYKMRDLPADAELVTRDLRLAVNPVHGLRLQGSYVENPEGADGQVRNTTDTTLSLDSTIGSLAFGGSYTAGASAAAAEQREQSEVRLSLSLWGHARLYGDYQTSQERAGNMTDNQTLCLGFTRSLSDHFYLLLEGALTEVQVNGVPQPGMGDQRAQAKLALRF